MDRGSCTIASKFGVDFIVGTEVVDHRNKHMSIVKEKNRMLSNSESLRTLAFHVSSKLTQILTNQRSGSHHAIMQNLDPSELRFSYGSAHIVGVIIIIRG
jgi:hypothetical protein